MRKSMRASKGKPAEDFVWLHTNMTESDVVHGGIDKLRRAIYYAEKQYRPEVILIANGCVPGIIGDDIDSLATELNDRLTAKIVPVHCEGLKSRFVASGYDSAYHAVIRHLVEPIEDYEPAFPDEERDALKRYNISRTVNIFNVGSNSATDEAELSRLVAALGLIPRVLPLHSSLDDLGHISEAALNVSICATHDDYLLGHLKERYGIPYIIDTLPIGTRSVGRWLRAIAKEFDLEETAERVIAQEEAKLNEALEPIRKQLAGKSVYVGGGELRIITTADFFSHDLGMKLLGVKAHHADGFITDLLEDLLDPNLQIQIGAGQPAEELALLLKLKPSLYVGHGGANGWTTRLGIPSIPLYGQTLNYMGYSGAFELARKASKALKNTNFAKAVSANVGLPLSKEWFESDITKNIKETETVG
jgi:nitrogenase molybdenum-iron protein alpha chain